MTSSLTGIHHITAISSSPQKTLDFYAGILGLRLVKLTVNFDDPSLYHLYFGDSVGSPGTILTFFPMPYRERGQQGAGKVTSISYSIRKSSADYWRNRLSRYGITVSEPISRFGQEILAFSDPDGLPLEFVVDDSPKGRPWDGSDVPFEHGLTSFAGVTLSLDRTEMTSLLLTEQFGFVLIGEEDNRLRFQISYANTRQTVDLVLAPSTPPRGTGAGTVHHIAWRCRHDEQQRWRSQLTARGIHVTDIRDRKYFRSIYFREPGGVLFEIATDQPGFAVDEPEEHLGSRLMLPEWLEARRQQIEPRLPPVDLLLREGVKAG